MYRLLLYNGNIWQALIWRIGNFYIWLPTDRKRVDEEGSTIELFNLGLLE